MQRPSSFDCEMAGKKDCKLLGKEVPCNQQETKTLELLLCWQQDSDVRWFAEQLQLQHPLW